MFYSWNVKPAWFSVTGKDHFIVRSWGKLDPSYFQRFLAAFLASANWHDSLILVHFFLSFEPITYHSWSTGMTKWNFLIKNIFLIALDTPDCALSLLFNEVKLSSHYNALWIIKILLVDLFLWKKNLNTDDTHKPPQNFFFFFPRLFFFSSQ